MTNKKILIVGLYPPPFSSGERVITQYVHDLLKPRYNIVSVDMSVGVLAPPTFKLASVAYYAKVLLNFAFVFKSVYFLSRRQKFDLCYLTPASSTLGHIRDIIILKLLNSNVKKVVINIQNGNYDVVFKRNWHKKFTSSYISRISTAIFTSEILKRRSEQYIGANKCVVINNTVDKDIKCSAEEVSAAIAYKMQRTEFVIYYISNMTVSKGYMDLFNAVKNLNEKERKFVKVNFIGEWLSNEQLQEFEELVDKYQIKKNIVIHGKVNDRKKLKAFYLDANVFVLPTYFPREAQPVSIIEALNAGVPVIATNHASIPDLVKDNINGLLVEIKSPADIQSALSKLLQNKEIWLNMSNNARDYFNKNFTSEKIRADILNLFDKELNK